MTNKYGVLIVLFQRNKSADSVFAPIKQIRRVYTLSANNALFSPPHKFTHFIMLFSVRRGTIVDTWIESKKCYLQRLLFVKESLYLGKIFDVLLYW